MWMQWIIVFFFFGRLKHLPRDLQSLFNRLSELKETNTACVGETWCPAWRHNLQEQLEMIPLQKRTKSKSRFSYQIELPLFAWRGRSFLFVSLEKNTTSFLKDFFCWHIPNIMNAHFWRLHGRTNEFTKFSPSQVFPPEELVGPAALVFGSMEG